MVNGHTLVSIHLATNCSTMYSRFTINSLNHFKCFCGIKTGFSAKINRCTSFSCFFHYDLWHRKNRPVTSRCEYVPHCAWFELKLDMHREEDLLTNVPKFDGDCTTSTMFSQRCRKTYRTDLVLNSFSIKTSVSSSVHESISVIKTFLLKSTIFQLGRQYLLLWIPIVFHRNVCRHYSNHRTPHGNIKFAFCPDIFCIFLIVNISRLLDSDTFRDIRYRKYYGGYLSL